MSSNNFDVQPMRLLSSEEKSVLERTFILATGLEREQFAMNSWGFPIIPIPEKRVMGDRIRLAPQNLKSGFLGHPIYWIDPELTKWDRDDEPEEHWSIRMYFLILSFGLWGVRGSRNWVNYPATLHLPNVDITDESVIEAYHQSNMPRCRFDDIPLLQEEDMRIPQQQWKREFEGTIAECSRILDGQVNDFYAKQMAALANALDVFGSNVDLRDRRVSPVNPGGWWMREVHPEAMRVGDRYQRALREGSVSSLEKPMRELSEKVRVQMQIMAQSIAILMVPIIRTATTESEAFSEMLTFYRIGVLESSTTEGMWDYSSYIETMIVDYPFRDDGVLYSIDDWVRRMYRDYSDVWKRLRLVSYNYEALRQGAPPMKTYDELTAYLAANFDSVVAINESTLEDVGNMGLDGLRQDGEPSVDPEDIYKAVDSGDVSELGLSQTRMDDLDDITDEDEELAELVRKNFGGKR